MTSYSGKLIRKTPLVPTQTSASGVWTTADAAAAVKNNTWPVAGVPDPISRSVRLRSSASAYFNRTPIAVTDGKKWTWSAWVKRGALANQGLFDGYASNTAFTTFSFYNDTFLFYNYVSSVEKANMATPAVFRDPSAWYHIVLVYDSANATSANRVIIYVNGVRQTLTTTTAVTQNDVTYINNTSASQRLGIRSDVPWYFDGYVAETNFIDGQALTPSSFGTTNALTGAWIPMAYTGTYGTNGFYLNFKDNTSTTTLGYDYSGNSNNWTANNISLTAGTTYDSMIDVPTPWIGYNTDGGASVTRGNYAVMSPINASTSGLASGGNLDISIGSGVAGLAATMSVTSGKWYWEFIAGTSSTSSYYVSICDTDKWSGPSQTQTTMYNSANVWSYYGTSGQKINSGSVASYGATYTSGDVIGVALDMDAGTVTFYKNNTSQGQAFSGLTGKTIAPWIGNGSSGNSAAGSINFGQRPFSYTPPTGFKSLCTTNLTTPTITNGANYMGVSLYTGTGATQSIVNSGSNAAALTFQPDFVWIKSRSNAVSNSLFDSVRGATKSLISNLTDAEYTATDSLTAFNSNGFALGANTVGGANVNVNAYTYVGWQWKKGATQGFDIVTYTGNGATQNINHSLGVSPKMMIVKQRSSTSNWSVYHQSLGAGNVIWMNLTNAFNNTLTYWNNTAPTSSQFSVGNAADTNTNAATYVAYCWSEVAGYSKFGSYTGNGSADGPFVYCGFRPRFIMWKKATGVAADWNIFDTARDLYNVEVAALYPNLSNAEVTSFGKVDVLSNGFKLRVTNTDTNVSGETYIFAAFAENPFNYSNAR